MVRRFACRILTEGGYAVVEACDGAEALDLVVRESLPPDLVLLDIMMPRLSGVELLEHLSVMAPGPAGGADVRLQHGRSEQSGDLGAVRAAVEAVSARPAPRRGPAVPE
jgi:CheY-like chemotaxis protein